jgi:NAD(P)H-dependent FMN reductase
MTNVLLVVGSARKGRVADKVTELVKQELAKRYDVTTTVADLKELDLPFFDNEIIPSSPDYEPVDERVATWSELVAAADKVVFITPEYNHTLSAIQKNALDSLYKEWENKPVAAVAYGWVGGARAITTLKIVLGNLKADLKETVAELAFMKQIDTSGAVIDQPEVEHRINATLDEVLA